MNLKRRNVFVQACIVAVTAATVTSVEAFTSRQNRSYKTNSYDEVAFMQEAKAH